MTVCHLRKWFDNWSKDVKVMPEKQIFQWTLVCGLQTTVMIYISKILSGYDGHLYQVIRKPREGCTVEAVMLPKRFIRLTLTLDIQTWVIYVPVDILPSMSCYGGYFCHVLWKSSSACKGCGNYTLETNCNHGPQFMARLKQINPLQLCWRGNV